KDFLPMLRSWYEEAKRLPIWQKLRLIVVHSTEIYVPLQLNQSPFNVGLPIQLDNFSFEQVQQLAQCYGIDWNDGEEARQLIDLVGGHPALKIFEIPMELNPHCTIQTKFTFSNK
ncbi:MAG: AAA-like domain-containing protein, partial [Nostoc sp.]